MRAQLCERGGGDFRLNKKDHGIDALTFQRRRIAGGFDAHDARIYSGHAQAPRVDSAHMLGIGVVGGDLGDEASAAANSPPMAPQPTIRM
jgi:hypothetical protein